MSIVFADGYGPFGEWKGRRNITAAISPELGQWILDNCNTRNRPRSEIPINRYASDMAAGLWKDTGDTFVFDWNGELIDGQHRLFAGVRANYTIQADIALGRPPEAFEATGCNWPRTNRHAIVREFGDIDSPIIVGAVAAMVMHYEDGIRSFLQTKFSAAATRPAILAMLRQRPAISASAAVGSHLGSGGKAKRVEAFPRVLGFCHFMFGQIDSPGRDYFFQAMETGIGLESGDPILVLRKKLAETEKVFKGRAANATQAQLQCIIKAWNAHREGRSIKYLTVEFTSPKKVTVGDFPDII